LGDNARLDSLGFAPFGQVTEGMDVVDKLHNGYGDGADQAAGPHRRRGERVPREDLSALDAIKKATIE
jgi:cyclophilin family peptidyl-prolyl cis-trans isomerase